MSNIKLTQLTELLSVSASNTILMATDLSVSPNVSYYVRVGTLTQTDYGLANAAFLKANVAFNTGYSANSALFISGLAFNQANSAYSVGTSAGDLAQAAYHQANTDLTIASLAFNQANLDFIHANSAYNLANNTAVLSQSAYNQANTDFIHANSAYNLANTILSNSSSLNLAQAAYNQANTDFIHANSAFNKANSSYITFSSGFNVANNAALGVISGTALAQAAFNKANTDFDVAQAAYNQANTASLNNGTTLAQAAFDKANSTFVYSTAGFMQANSAYSLATGAVMRAGDTITGIVMAPTAANGTSNSMIATTQFVNNQLTLYATGLGINQTWSDVTLSRANNVTYTNTTGKPIMVHVKASFSNSSYGAYVVGYVGSVEAGFNRDNGSAGATSINPSINFIVPPGQTYKLLFVGSGASLLIWTELR